MKKTNSKQLVEMYQEIISKNNELSLDQVLHQMFNNLKESDNDSFGIFKEQVLKANNINEYEYYTRDVNTELKSFVQNEIFPEYEKNDKAHGIIHIKTVIVRALALNDTLKLGLEINKIFTIAACHDLGKYIDHEIHEKIAAKLFIQNDKFKKFFGDKDLVEIKEAIEDHRSSFDDIPRSDYGKLISSADRNTSIEIVFIRSFFVGKSRTPDITIEEFLEFTFKRLSKRYSVENPENMFFEDETYKMFLSDMRRLLKDEKEFKIRYCIVNNIQFRDNKLYEEVGITEFYDN